MIQPLLSLSYETCGIFCLDLQGYSINDWAGYGFYSMSIFGLVSQRKRRVLTTKLLTLSVQPPY
jgi:hypothetical protein